ncbi:MAG: restriction endonuclease-like protein [Firmicutes bacterium]|nr:DUF2357 domain-containing protein [Alicyclobacillaceae bacterium]MCL6497178.1 restriction endonuclease-like protein [Bacillota bacterium]
MPPIGELARVEAGETAVILVGPTAHDRLTWPTDPPSGPVLRTIGRGLAVICAPRFPLFDDVEYRLRIIGPAPVTLHLSGQPLEVSWSQHRGTAVGDAVLRFRQLGWVEFTWSAPPCGFAIAVSSRKLDYEADYLAMVHDLERQIRGLSARLVSPVLQESRSLPEPSDLDAHWLAVLRSVRAELLRDLQAAWYTLPPRLAKQESQRDLDRARRIGYREVARLWATGRPRVYSSRPTWTLLTPERRYLLDLAQHLHRRLQGIARRHPGLSLPEIAAFGQELERVMHRWTWEAADAWTPGRYPIPPASPLAQAHPALRRVIQWHRRLNQGLLPEAGRWLLGMKDVSLLYEYWCYLTIVRLVVEESQGTLQVPPKARPDPVGLVLGSGEESAAQVCTASGELVRIVFRRRYHQLPTVSQEPDHVVYLRAGRRLLVFDAKYRLCQDPKELEAYGEGLWIPPVETLNQMHQYRDAIRDRGPNPRRLVHIAVVLFPLPAPQHAEWSRHRFCRSIEAVGVGALPALPGRVEGLRKLIRRHLDHASSTPPASATPRPPW